MDGLQGVTDNPDQIMISFGDEKLVMPKRKKPKTELDDETEEEDAPLKHHLHFHDAEYGPLPILDGSDLEQNQAKQE